MRLLVTGANGHVGFAVAGAALVAGHRVRAGLRMLDGSRTAALDRLGVLDRVALDVRDADAFVRAAEGMDAIVHVAATYAYFTRGRDGDREMIRDSVEGAVNALDAASRAGVPQVVLTSSVVTLPLVRPGEPRVDETSWREDLSVPYFRAKVEAERAAHERAERSGVRLSTILPGAVGGGGFSRRTPSTDIVEGIMLGTMRFGAPDGNIPYVDVDDVARAHVLAAEKAVGGRFIVTNDEQPDLRRLTRLLNAVDPSIPVAKGLLPRNMARHLPMIERVFALLLGAPRVVTPELAAALDGRIWHFDNGRAKRELGWRPEVPIEESLKRLVARLEEIRRSEGRRRAD